MAAFLESDWPLELLELSLIAGLAIGAFIQQRALKRDKRERDASQKQLSAAQDELHRLRRMLDRILMVEKGYARPGEPFEGEDPAPRKRRPSRLP